MDWKDLCKKSPSHYKSMSPHYKSTYKYVQPPDFRGNCCTLVTREWQVDTGIMLSWGLPEVPGEPIRDTGIWTRSCEAVSITLLPVFNHHLLLSTDEKELLHHCLHLFSLWFFDSRGYKGGEREREREQCAIGTALEMEKVLNASNIHQGWIHKCHILNKPSTRQWQRKGT